MQTKLNLEEQRRMGGIGIAENITYDIQSRHKSLKTTPQGRLHIHIYLLREINVCERNCCGL